MKEKYGFVYIWRDQKHKRYYIGCHWGTEDDGYICSSRWMRSSYKRRPLDFKRRTLSRVITSRADLLEEEYHWLQKIPVEELGGRYYNLTNHSNGHWTADPSKVLTVREKISAAQKKNFEDPAYRARFMETRKQLPPQTDETRERRRQSMIGKNTGRPKTAKFYEARERIRGTPLTEDRKQLVRNAGVMKRLNSTKVQCPHCGVYSNVGNIARYHNNNCKRKEH